MVVTRATIRSAAQRAHARARPAFSWLPVLGLVPAFLLATWSLTQPWARGRALLLVGISRSPSAALLVVVTLAAVVGASIMAATRGRRRDIAAGVHIVAGIAMIVVALGAFHLIRHAPTKLLGFVPVASVKPATGLYIFLGAAVAVLALGALEAWLWTRRRKRRAS